MKKKRKAVKKNKLNDEDKIELELVKKGEKLENSIINKIRSFLHLHLDNYSTTHGRRIEGGLFLLNFIVIVLFIIDTHGPTGTWKSVINVIEVSIISIFIIEYIARMWIAKHKVKHFFNAYSIIDLVAILPILVHFANLSFFRVFRILRLFRMLRVLRFQRIFKSKNTMFGKLNDSQLIIIRIVITIFTIVLISSGLIWTVESKINPDQIGTIWDAMYFAIVTITTVGYGDVTPLSTLGKVITILMILSGIALIPWQLGKLIKVLFLEATKTKSHCSKCGLEEHDKDAHYCRNCGQKLKKKQKKQINMEEEL